MKKLAASLVILGLASLVTGLALIYVPAALIVGGVTVGALGLFALPVDQA